jgi:dienelactone hydrolase
MKRGSHGLLLGLLALMLAACGDQAPTPAPPTATPPAAPPATPSAGATPAPAGTDRVAAAQQLVADLHAGQFDAAESRFDSTMQAQLPADKLRDIWATLELQAGAFQQVLGTRTERVQQYDAVYVTTAFEKQPIDIKIVFDAQGQVAGLFFAPAASGRPTVAAPTTTPGAYVQPDRFTDTAIEVHSGDWTLPGTLSMPKGDGPFPGVVLVAGSGPQDQDETIGPNKPFRDLAGGLASAGIAVLRYDKRTKVDPIRAAIPNITVKEEVIDDAVAALALLRQTPGVDAKRVFLLGHSLGGMLAPRIAQADPQIAGLIILAGPTQPLEDSILEQYTYIASLGGANGQAAQQQLAQIKQQVARVKDPNLSPDTPASELPLGVPASYWLDLRDYHPAEVAATLPQPMLILRGSTDYQVTAQDMQGWQDALAGRDNVAFKTYPGLYHLFMPSQDPTKGTPSDYEHAGHVAPDVVSDIAAWIRGH